MTRKEFLKELAQIREQFVWSVDGKKIVGVPKKGRKQPVSPILAVVNTQERAKGKKLSRDFTRAAESLKLGFNERYDIDEACNAEVRRGYPQVLRGRIKKTLGL